MDEELLKIARRVYDKGEVYTTGGSLVITKRANRSYISGVFDNGTRLPRFYGKLEFEYLLGICEEFSVIVTAALNAVSFSLVFKHPKATGAKAEDFVYPAADPQADKEWQAKQPDLSEFMNGTAPVLINRNFRETMKMQRVSKLVREVFRNERASIEDFGLFQEDQDDEAIVRYTLSFPGTNECLFSGERLRDFRALIDTTDYVQILAEKTDLGTLFEMTFGVYDVRF